MFIPIYICLYICIYIYVCIYIYMYVSYVFHMYFICIETYTCVCTWGFKRLTHPWSPWFVFGTWHRGGFEAQLQA